MMTFSPIRTIAAALFLLAAVLGTPGTQDKQLSIGAPVSAAAKSAQEETPRYWQMYYNFAPPTDAFIAELAAEQGVPYTEGKGGEARFYADDGRPIYPSNDGAVGVIVTITLPSGDVLTRYGKPTGRYVSPDGMTFDERALPSTTNEGDFHVYLVERVIDNVQKGKIAPWFGRAGGGIQYKLPDRIINLINAAPPYLSDVTDEEVSEAA